MSNDNFNPWEFIPYDVAEGMLNEIIVQPMQLRNSKNPKRGKVSRIHWGNKYVKAWGLSLISPPYDENNVIELDNGKKRNLNIRTNKWGISRATDDDDNPKENEYYMLLRATPGSPFRKIFEGLCSKFFGLVCENESRYTKYFKRCFIINDDDEVVAKRGVDFNPKPGEIKDDPGRFLHFTGDKIPEENRRMIKKLYRTLIKKGKEIEWDTKKPIPENAPTNYADTVTIKFYFGEGLERKRRSQLKVFDPNTPKEDNYYNEKLVKYFYGLLNLEDSKYYQVMRIPVQVGSRTAYQKKVYPMKKNRDGQFVPNTQYGPVVTLMDEINKMNPRPLVNLDDYFDPMSGEKTELNKYLWLEFFSCWLGQFYYGDNKFGPQSPVGKEIMFRLRKQTEQKSIHDGKYANRYSKYGGGQDEYEYDDVEMGDTPTVPTPLPPPPETMNFSAPPPETMNYIPSIPPHPAKMDFSAPPPETMNFSAPPPKPEDYNKDYEAGGSTSINVPMLDDNDDDDDDMEDKKKKEDASSSDDDDSSSEDEDIDPPDKSGKKRKREVGDSAANEQPKKKKRKKKR